MKGKTRSLSTIFSVMKNPNSGSHLQDLQTSEILLIPRPKLTTGLMRTGIEYLFILNIRIRLWNEESKDYELKRAQMYMVQGFVISSYVLGVKSILTVIYHQMNTRTRYIRDSYKELDISELPPGEVLQTSWNGELIFIRRLTLTEVKDTNSLPDSSLLDKVSVTSLSDAGNSNILVCSAICTHLGCIPVPYLGAYKGWVCLCHGSVYDKFGRVRQGPAQNNLPYINNSVYGPVICIEEQIFPNEPSVFLYV
jgi:ubiquinol-cytochrome c reductase iron-sulfur subunit